MAIYWEGIFAVFAILLFFGILAYRRIPAPVLGLLVSVIIILILGMPMDKTLLGPYMSAAGSYFKNFWLVFFLGALYGAIMEKTGAALVIAEALLKFGRGYMAPVVIMTVTGILTYGGISGFVIFFTMWPIALHVFRETNLPRKLIPAAISAGTWTWSMVGPATPAIQNIIPMKYLGTSPNAALGPGLAAIVIEFVLICGWLYWRAKTLVKNGETFDKDEVGLRLAAEGEKVLREKIRPPLWIAVAPLILLIFLFDVLKIPIETALIITVLIATLMLFKQIGGYKELLSIMNDGSQNGAMAILNTACIVGFAGVMKETYIFKNLVDWLKTGVQLNPYWYVAITTTILAGIAGSASGGLGATFEALGDTFKALPISMEAVHRIASISAGILDTLPHQGAQITLLTICHLTHKEGYFDIAVTQLIIPAIALVATIPLYPLLGY